LGGEFLEGSIRQSAGLKAAFVGSASSGPKKKSWWGTNGETLQPVAEKFLGFQQLGYRYNPLKRHTPGWQEERKKTVGCTSKLRETRTARRENRAIVLENEGGIVKTKQLVILNGH